MNHLIMADAVWPALYLTIRLVTWWVIMLSLLIEGFALWRYAGLKPAKAILAALIMNVISAAFGFLFLPTLGLGLEFISDQTFNSWFDMETFNPVSFVLTWLMATVVTTSIESVVLWLVFMMPWQRRWMTVMLIANAATVALAGISAFLFVE